MNGTTGLILGWWLHTLLGGGVLLLLAWLLMQRIVQPARRQRLAECALLGALLLAGLSLAPTWLNIPLPWPVESPPAPEPVAVAPEAAPEMIKVVHEPEVEGAVVLVPLLVPQDNPEPALPAAAVEEQAPAPKSEPMSPFRISNVPWVAWMLGIYAAGSALLLGRWLLGHLALARLLRSARPAPAGVLQLCAELCSDRPPRLLVSPRVRVPFSFGLIRPTIVLPVDLSDEKALRWVLAHELAHLERRDAWACLLFGLGQVVYFVLPWFWWLRRQVRLCQEYVADAAAASAGQPEDYAQLLLGWSQAPRLPVGVTGVSGPSSDLYRRISMLLQSATPVEKRCPRSWTLLMAAGILGLSVVVAGVGLKAVAAPAPEPKKEEPKKDEPKKDDTKKEQPKKDEPNANARKAPDPFEVMPNFDRLFENMPGVDQEQLKQMREQMKRAHEEMRKAMEQARQMQGVPFPQGGFMVPGFVPFGRLDRQDGHQGRLGAHIQAPSDTLVAQLDLPRGQGLVVDEIVVDSAANKAGLKAHDILLEVGGKVVPNNPEEFVKQLREIKANTPVDVVVLRKGKKETLKGLSLPEAKVEKAAAQPQFGGFQGFGPGFQGQFQGFGPGGQAVMMQTSRNGDEFTIKRKEGDLSITIQGKVDDGKAVPSSIQIDDGNGAKNYESVDKVPETHRESVKKMLPSVTGGQAIKRGLRQF
jgi:beta-lactamase regulating signal transducer with metallopeptidase domain